MQDILNKIYIIFLSAMMGTGMIAPAPISYEGDTLDTDEQASELSEETSEEELPVWPTTISEEIYDVIKDINFDSCRIIAAIDESYIFDKSVILSEYEGVYLLQFEDKDTTMAAYAYLMQYADFIDVDTAVEIAEEDESSEDTPITTDTVMSEEENPFKELSDSLKEQPDIDSDNKVIALIDSGVGHHETKTDEEGEEHDILVQDEHVINSVSVIGEDTTDDNGHGDRMLAYILEEAPDAQIMSIKAIGEDGKGDISAVYAAMMYAIENDADIINLSLSAPATAENAVLKDAVEKANKAGITVVASAGNNNKDARFYVPGNLEGVYTIGSADENGEKLALSNYGDCVDYNVVSETTSEAAARFGGILYNSSIEDIDATINTSKVFEPKFEKSTVSIPDEVAEDESVTITGTEDDRGVTSIDTLESELFFGAEMQEYMGDDIYVWAVPNNNANHRFSFRVTYDTSGVAELLPGELEIHIPRHIMKNRNGGYADKFEIAIPLDTEVDDDDLLNDLVYKIDGDDIVIYNRVAVNAATEGYFEVSYITTQANTNFTDMGESDPFVVTISAKAANDLGVDKIEHTSEPISVYIDTYAKLSSSSKKFPTLYKTWQSGWGTRPDDADDYWYLLWEVSSNVNISQPYSFSITDTIGQARGWDYGETDDDEVEIEIPEDAYSFVGYRMRGSSTFTDINTVDNQTADSQRYDFVLTKLKKSVFSPLKRYQVNNSVVATLTPADGLDPVTTARSSRMFSYEKPVFRKPTGSFTSWKRADGNYRSSRTTPLSYLGMKAADYTRYDLEKFKDGTLQYMDNFDYAAWIIGNPWPWTLEDENAWRDPDDYGKVPVHYTLTDESFYLQQDGGVKSERLLTSEDFQIDKLSIGVSARDAYFNEDSQSFVSDSVEWREDDVLNIYAKLNDSSQEYVLVARLDLASNTTTILDEDIVRFITVISSNPRSVSLTFNDNVVGFKLETTNAHFNTEIDAVPNIRLKNSDYVMETIEEWDSIAIRNVSNNTVDQEKNGITKTLYSYDESDTDFAREIVRNSFIDKSVVSGSNETKKKRYRITWKTKLYEQYTMGMGEKVYLVQDSGTFYDLLPAGLTLDPASIAVKTEKGYLPANLYSFDLTYDYKESGRTMLVVNIDEPANFYELYFDTLIDWNTIKDLGTRVYNPIAYRTGNDDIKNGSPDDGGNLKRDKEIMSGLSDELVETNKFLYSSDEFDIVALTSATTGLSKQIKELDALDYVYDIETLPGGDYTYRMRYSNTFSVSSKNLILFDSLENYGTDGLVGDDIVDHEPDWKGSLQGIDVSQLRLMGIAPVVYVSEIEHLDLDKEDGHHDITDAAIWVNKDTYLETHDDLSAVRAVAIDASKNTNGEGFILGPGQSIMAVLFMKAPYDAEADGTRVPETFNNVYLSNTTIDKFDNENDFYIHHDYTSARIYIKGDVKLTKVSEEDRGKKIRNIKFRLTGTSDYGTNVDEILATNYSGGITFKDVEKGTYLLQEYQTTSDWLEDHTEHTVLIDEEGKTYIDSVDHTEEPVIITNKPRVHANINILKREKNVEGALVFEDDTWDPETMVKYAVALYGIGQDYDENGKQMGLTFGPATDADYVNSYKSHTPTGTTQTGNPHHCIHDDSWDEICYWNFVDPCVYEQCIKECCTHSVNLTLPETIRNTMFLPNYTGDGPSMLSLELSGTSTGIWNKATSNVGGWGASRVRAMLNGADDLTDSSVAGDAAALYTAGTTLFDAFPTILQETIGNKAVKYDPVWSAKTESNLKVSYDKLWLLSSNEIGDNTSIIDTVHQHPLEALDDGIYQRFIENNEKLSDRTGSPFFSGRRVDNTTSGTSSSYDWWLRSIDSYYDIYNVLSVFGGRVSGMYGPSNYGISPCFSLTKNASIVVPASPSGSKPSWIDQVTGYQALNSHHYLNGLIPDTTFLLQGTSVYGTDVAELYESNNLGQVSFNNIEQGSYTLIEINENPYFLKDGTVWHFTIDENGMVSSDIEQTLGLSSVIENTPRYWSFPIHKVDAEDNNIWLQGATVRLSGISDFGNEYSQTVTSDENGIIQFTEFEKGTYILEELTPPTGVDAEGHTGTGGNRNYLADPVKHIVKIDENGIVTIDGLDIGGTGEFYLKNERALDGKITVLKHWEYIEGEELPTPNLTLVNYEPGTEPAFAITYDANGGYFDNGRTTNIVYVKQEGQLSVIKSGQVKTPVFDTEKIIFDGWYTDSACTNRFAGVITDNTTVYAKWKDSRVRYAVSIYGIGQDVDINGNTMGLTFGPATGADYVNDFKRHDATGTTTTGNEHRCVHDDSWDEIIYWNGVDPEVYEQCVGECCTKSVPLSIPESIKTTNATYANYTGDGPSALKDELQGNARVWNAYSYGSSTYAIYDNANGWGGSNIRAVLNGVDDDDSDGIVTNIDVYARAQSLTADNALIAAFPQNLQDAIGYKAVKYDSVYNAFNDANLKTSYDKLWLPSNAEMGRYIGYGDHVREALDDGIYQRVTENNVTLSASSHDLFKGYCASNITSPTAAQTGTVSSWVTRSIYSSSYQNGVVIGINTGGAVSNWTAHSSSGVSPCFALSRTPSD